MVASSPFSRPLALGNHGHVDAVQELARILLLGVPADKTEGHSNKQTLPDNNEKTRMKSDLGVLGVAYSTLLSCCTIKFLSRTAGLLVLT